MTIRQRILAFATTIMVGFALAVAVASPASAAVFGPFWIVAPNTGLCLDVTGVSYSNGAYLQLYRCLDNQPNQQFYLYEAGQAWRYQIVAAHSGKCLDVTGFSYSDGVDIQQYTCLGWSQTNQIFDELDAGQGNSYFKAVHSGKCISYYLPAVETGNVIQFSCYTRWRLVGV